MSRTFKVMNAMNMKNSQHYQPEPFTLPQTLQPNLPEPLHLHDPPLNSPSFQSTTYQPSFEYPYQPFFHLSPTNIYFNSLLHRVGTIPSLSTIRLIRLSNRLIQPVRSYAYKQACYSNTSKHYITHTPGCV